MKEIWKDIPGYEGKYQVSNLGNVKSLTYRNAHVEKLLTPRSRKTDEKHLYVSLCKDCNGKSIYIHDLVALVFLEKGNGQVVHHKDENPSNNCVDNLIWLTVEEHNAIHGRAKKPVICIETGVIYDSVCQAGKLTGLSSSHISMVCRGLRKTTGGYHWEYINQSL